MSGFAIITPTSVISPVNHSDVKDIKAKVGHLIIHEGFGHLHQAMAITTPCGATVGHYPNISTAKRVAKYMNALIVEPNATTAAELFGSMEMAKEINVAIRKEMAI